MQTVLKIQTEYPQILKQQKNRDFVSWTYKCLLHI